MVPLIGICLVDGGLGVSSSNKWDVGVGKRSDDARRFPPTGPIGKESGPRSPLPGNPDILDVTTWEEIEL